VTPSKSTYPTDSYFYVILLINYIIRIPCCQLSYCLLAVLNISVNHFNIISAVLHIRINLLNELYMGSVCSTNAGKSLTCFDTS
jgi:hypothetical protein